MAAEVAEAPAAAGRPAPPGTREPGPVHFGGGPRATVARGGKAKRLRGELAKRVGAKLGAVRRDACAGKREARDQARARLRRADCEWGELPPLEARGRSARGTASASDRGPRGPDLEDASARAPGPRPALASAAKARAAHCTAVLSGPARAQAARLYGTQSLVGSGRRRGPVFSAAADSDQSRGPEGAAWPC